MPIATNAQGEAVRLDENGSWVPTKLATNPQTGDRLALDGNQWVALPKPPTNPISDVVRSIPGGAAKGVAGLVGLPGTIEDALDSGFTALANKVTGANVAAPRSPFSADALEGYVSKPFGGFYEPQTTAGKYAETIASFAPLAAGGEASLARRALGRVLAPAVGSETAGEIPGVQGTALEPLARLVGGGVAGSPALAGAARGLIAGKLAPQLAASLAPEDAQLVAKYETMGGHLRPGQYSPSNFIRQGDSVIADSLSPRAAGFAKDSSHAVLPSQQADEFNNMLAGTFGENAPRITDQVVANARDRIGNVYKEVLPRNSIRMDDPLAASMGDIDNRISEALPAMKPDDANAISGVMNRLRGLLSSDTGVPGKLYQNYRERGGLLDELSGSGSPVLSRAATDMRRAFDDAFARQAQGTDGAALSQARDQYRALSTLEPIINKSPSGNINPGAVLAQVVKEYGSPGNAGNLGTLGRVGAAFLKSQPSSGTAERTAWRSIINKPFSEGIPAIANSVISLPVNLLASRQLNKVINSPEMRAKLLAAALSNPGAAAGQTGSATAAQLAQALKGAP